MTATDIDYEAEYNNRARVPEHPQIFERWRAAAKEFRDEMAAQGRAELAVPYGTTPRQIIDFFLAEPDSGRLAVFVHGGYWRSLEPETFSHLARGLVAHGISVAVAGYDLCPQVQVADIVGEIRQACLHLWRRFGKRMFVYGHSAGGQLAACALATDWKAYGMPDNAVPAACAVSGLFWDAPRGRVLDVIVGAQESREFLRQSREIADAWAKAGTTTRCEEAPGNHFTVLDPLADPGSATVKRLAALAEQTP